MRVKELVPDGGVAQALRPHPRLRADARRRGHARSSSCSSTSQGGAARPAAGSHRQPRRALEVPPRRPRRPGAVGRLTCRPTATRCAETSTATRRGTSCRPTASGCATSPWRTILRHALERLDPQYPRAGGGHRGAGRARRRGVDLARAVDLDGLYSRSRDAVVDPALAGRGAGRARRAPGRAGARRRHRPDGRDQRGPPPLAGRRDASSPSTACPSCARGRYDPAAAHGAHRRRRHVRRADRAAARRAAAGARPGGAHGRVAADPQRRRRIGGNLATCSPAGDGLPGARRARRGRRARRPDGDAHVPVARVHGRGQAHRLVGRAS